MDVHPTINGINVLIHDDPWPYLYGNPLHPKRSALKFQFGGVCSAAADPFPLPRMLIGPEGVVVPKTREGIVEEIGPAALDTFLILGCTSVRSMLAFLLHL